MNKTIWFVNHGVSSRHLFETKMFETLKSAKEFITELPIKRAYTLIRQDLTGNSKIDERVI